MHRKAEDNAVWGCGQEVDAILGKAVAVPG